MSVSHYLSQGLQQAWYKNAGWLILLRPLSGFYGYLVKKRQRQYECGQREVWKAPVPVVVIGNITVGGSGKTPLVIAIANQLKQLGWQPGIVSRGYGASAKTLVYPLSVTTDCDPRQSGDEPLLMAQRTACPVVVDADRVAAVKKLLADNVCDIVLSDDGLQHQRLARDIEICVIDGQRGLGNNRLLPEGPLREPATRLADVDMIVLNGDSAPCSSGDGFSGDGFSGDGISENGFREDQYVMHLQAASLQALHSTDEDSTDEDSTDKCSANESGRPAQLLPEVGATVHAVAGIGNPQRFFHSLRTLGYQITPHAFPDHHNFSADDFRFPNSDPIIMTEKDAVKCRRLPINNAWSLPVQAELPALFWQHLLQRLQLIQCSSSNTQSSRS